MAAVLAVFASSAWAAPPPALPALRATNQPASPSRPDSAAQRPQPTQEVDAGSRNVAARARMLECGHQWSNMKRAGTAAGTWKDFSRGCLAQK